MSWLVKTSEEKEKIGVKKKTVIDTLCERNINTFVEEHFSSESAKLFWYCCQSTMIKYQQPVFNPSSKLKLLNK